MLRSHHRRIHALAGTKIAAYVHTSIKLPTPHLFPTVPPRQQEPVSSYQAYSGHRRSLLTSQLGEKTGRYSPGDGLRPFAIDEARNAEVVVDHGVKFCIIKLAEIVPSHRSRQGLNIRFGKNDEASDPFSKRYRTIFQGSNIGNFGLKKQFPFHEHPFG
jgi:hypothetical protein